MLTMPLVIEARDLSKRFVLRHNAGEIKVRALGLLGVWRRGQRREEFWALRGVSLRINDGESLALVGRNGSGKSTFLKLVAGIHQPTGGHLCIRRGAHIASMIELGTGFHPELTGQENVLLNASIHGLSRAEALADLRRRRARTRGSSTSWTCRSRTTRRACTCASASRSPRTSIRDILLLDEIFAVGDEEFQRQCMATLQEFLAAGTHDPLRVAFGAAVQAICRRVCVLEAVSCATTATSTPVSPNTGG